MQSHLWRVLKDKDLEWFVYNLFFVIHYIVWMSVEKNQILLWIFCSPIYVKLISKALLLWVAAILRKNLTFNHHFLNEFSCWGDPSLINYSQYKLVLSFLFIILQIYCYLFNVQLWRTFQIINFCVSKVFLDIA